MNTKLQYSVCFAVSRPSAPAPPVVTEVRATSFTVTYQPPRRDGGAPVTGYILERRTQGTDSEWVRVNDTPVTDLQYTIDNLTPYTEYEFRVAATNKSEVGDFSSVSLRIMTAVVKPDKPGQPEVIEVIGTSVCLQWTTPHSDGGTDIIQYIVMCNTSDKTEYIAVAVDTNTESLISHTIRNQLQPHTKYTFAVAAVNRFGPGSWSDRTETTWTLAGMYERLFHIYTPLNTRHTKHKKDFVCKCNKC